MSQFNPEDFLNAQVTEVNERRVPLPTENPDDANGLYTAVIGEVTTASGVISKGDKTGQPWVSMVIPLKLEIPKQFQDSLGYSPNFTVTDRAFLDLTPQGGLDNGPGKNRQQKNYREATDLNKPGDVFAWRMLTGKVVKVKIAHEVYEGAVQERVANVLRA
jgi:hypothetical protein